MRQVIGIPPSEGLAKKISRKVGAKYSTMDIKSFPDKEFYFRFKSKIKGDHIYLCQSFKNPNDKIIEALFIADMAKKLKAKKVSLIAPYLPYMRADRQFHKGEIVSAKVLADILECSFDELITIDPHLHRIKKLSRIFKIKTTTLTSVELIADFIRKYKNPVVIGPDEESYQWACKVANNVGCEAHVLKKTRISSRDVKIKINHLDFNGKSAVVVDDIISTGHTMVEVVKKIKKMGCRKIYCVGVHGIFAESADIKLKKAGALEIVTTNTIPSKYSKIDISELIAETITFSS